MEPFCPSLPARGRRASCRGGGGRGRALLLLLLLLLLLDECVTRLDLKGDSVYSLGGSRLRILNTEEGRKDGVDSVIESNRRNDPIPPKLLVSGDLVFGL